MMISHCLEGDISSGYASSVSRAFRRNSSPNDIGVIRITGSHSMPQGAVRREALHRKVVTICHHLPTQWNSSAASRGTTSECRLPDPDPGSHLSYLRVPPGSCFVRGSHLSYSSLLREHLYPTSWYQSSSAPSSRTFKNVYDIFKLSSQTPSGTISS